MPNHYAAWRGCCLPARIIASLPRAACTRFALNCSSDCTRLSACSSSFAVLLVLASTIEREIASTLHDATQLTDLPVSLAHMPTVRLAAGVRRIPASGFVGFMHYHDIRVALALQWAECRYK